VVGDFGTGGVVEQQISDAIETWATAPRADALVTTGDNIYPAGETEDFADAWRRPYRWVSDGGFEVIASLGNHDVQADNEDEVMEVLGMPAPWYRERIGAAELFVLDSNGVADQEQVFWLQDSLAESRAAWQIAVFHQPAYSCAEYGSTEEVIEHWLPLFEAEGVDLVLNGHDHNYQRFESNGVTYIVTGGGGARLYDLDRCSAGYPRRLAGAVEHHFVTVVGSARSMRIMARDRRGRSIDAVTLTRAPG
jgi:hypothetical protein